MRARKILFKHQTELLSIVQNEFPIVSMYLLIIFCICVGRGVGRKRFVKSLQHHHKLDTDLLLLDVQNSSLTVSSAPETASASLSLSSVTVHCQVPNKLCKFKSFRLHILNTYVLCSVHYTVYSTHYAFKNLPQTSIRLHVTCTGLSCILYNKA